jgi:hypothetical protein
VYSLFSALIMHVYQMRSSVPSVVSASQERINVCMNALKEVSKVWLVAKMVHTLFESILGNKVLEERLQKATGKKAQRAKNNPREQGVANGNSTGVSHAGPAAHPIPAPPMNPAKRKFDEIDLGFNVGLPAPQTSYERSRPQTPAVTPSRETPQQPGQQSHNNFLGSPPLAESFLPPSRSRGASRMPSRGPTRANSPFNGYSIPATPPDLFLVTRDSPNISQQLWENFQPDQLFPDGTIGDGTGFATSPILNHAVDPQLQQIQGHQTGMTPGSQQVPHIDISGSGQQQQQGHTAVWPPGMSGMSGMMGTGMEMHDSDGWSTSSIGNAPVAPTTLNVEDWFQFFGINGEMSGMTMDTGGT